MDPIDVDAYRPTDGVLRLATVAHMILDNTTADEDVAWELARAIMALVQTSKPSLD